MQWHSGMTTFCRAWYFCKKEMYTLPIAMQVFYGTYTTDIGLILAALLLAMLPILILYVFLQRYIIEGVTSGAVKG